MSVVRSLVARWILNSRGHPTVEVDLTTDDGVFRAAVPSGASKGTREALELLDGGDAFYGRGVSRAIANINGIIAPAVVGQDCADQATFDRFLVGLDGTDNKSALGANAVLAVSLAAARAGAAARGIPLHEHLHRGPHRLPVPFMNVINGGAHAGNDLDIQEYMIAPTGFDTFHEALRAGVEVYHELRHILSERYGRSATNVGDEGGFAPPLSAPDEPLEIILESVEEWDYGGRIGLAVDAAASGFADGDGYLLDGRRLSGGELVDLYVELADRFPLVAIEDPFAEDDWASFREITGRLGRRLRIIGDDIFVSDPAIVRRGIEEEAANTVLLKVNQIGTVSEAIETVDVAFGAGLDIMVSHRSGETCDDFIADLAVAIGCGMIKAGAPCRSERTAKYNRLLRIAETTGLPYGLRERDA